MALVWTVLFFVAAELLLWSGGAKVLQPSATIEALRTTRLPSGAAAVRALGGLEILTGAVCLFRPSAGSALALTALYLAFAGFVLTRLAASERSSSSCGCFGAAEAPASWLHVGANLVAAAAGVGVAVGAPRAAVAVAAETPFGGVPFVVGLATAAYLAGLVLTLLPAAFGAYRRPEP